MRSGEAKLRQAVEALAAVIREKLSRHPQGHLAVEPRPGSRKSHLEIVLRIPVGSVDAALDDAAAAAEETLSAELEALVAERALLRPGRILCLRCGTSECEHAAPRSCREIFAGYAATGLPRFVDFGQWLLERGHPRLDEIYRCAEPRDVGARGVGARDLGLRDAGRRPSGRFRALVTEVVSGRELNEELLPAFRDTERDFRVHGQVVAGWFEVPHGAAPATLALCFQVLSTRRPQARGRGRRRQGRQERRRLTLSVLGAGPDGEPLTGLYDRLAAVPWQGVLAWGQQVLQTVESSQGRSGTTPEALSRRVEGLLKSIARRLEQDRRARDRRTGHAEKRHQEGDRPTRMARADLAQSAAESFYVDERRKTVIVLGERGRAHVWNAQGKLVTSIRYSPESIEKKLRQEVWRPATAEEVAGLKKRTGI